jgi:hypothetical protein
MATYRPNVPEGTKKALRDQAGGKCANPGCAAARTHIHHIREWAVYQSRDGKRMIAVCPSCHDAIHHGPLRISDRTLYTWKSITRTPDAKRGHLYVEPGREAKLLLGSIAVTGDAGLIAFELSEGNQVSFTLQNGEIMLLSLTITDRRKRQMARVVDGHVIVEPHVEVEYDHVPGHHTITAPVTPEYMPKWALERIQKNEADYQPRDRVTLLDLEVIEPGIVRVEGVWLETRKGVVITAGGIHLVRVDPKLDRSILLAGAGTETVLRYTGPITSALFGM